MPKKTKKQKILAQLHRKLQYASSLPRQNLKLNSSFVKGQNNNPIQDQISTYPASLDQTKETVVKAKTIQIDSSYTFVKNDLIRITIFTAVAVTLQGVLYFLLRTR